MARTPRMDAFTRQYLETALWSSSDESDDSGGEPLDKNYSVSDISEETLDKMIADCADFQERFAELITDDEQAGHDFWLTRNRHGAGFWDGDWPEPAATKLTEGSKEYGEVHLYVGDDGEIHGSWDREPGRSRRVDEAPHGGAADPHAAHELVLYIQNTSDLSPDGPRGQGRDVLLNALRKWRKGTYNPELAVNLFGYLAEAGAKRYAKDHGSGEPWSVMFTTATRREAAGELEAAFRGEAELGNYNNVDVRPGAREAHRGAPQRQQRAGSFVVTLSTGQTARFHDMPRAKAWAEERLEGRPAGTYAAFYRAAVGPNRSDTGAPWTEPFYMLTVDERGHIRVGDTRTVAPLPAQHPHRGIREARRSSKPDQRAVDFFYEHAGYSHDPKKETPEQGRKRGAVALAKAEQEATARGWRVAWEEDPAGWDSLGDIDPDDVRGMLQAVLYDENDNVLARLGSIVNPGRNYMRVVEAELALEALP